MSTAISERRQLSGRTSRLVAAFIAGLLIVGGSIFFAPPAFAAVVTVGELEYSTNPVDFTASVRGLDAGSTETDIVIPDTIVDGGDTYLVTSVNNNAFNNVGLTSVVIGDSVVTIGSSAFRSNAALVSVVLGESVVSIGNSAFSGAALTSLVIPDSVVTISDDAFRGSPIASLTLGASLETLGGGAFMNAVLTTLVLPDALVSIGNDVFRSSSITSLIIPDSVVAIGNSAFLLNPLTSLTLGNSLQTIGNQTFRGHELTTVVIPATVTQIGTLAFLPGVSILTSVVMQGAAPTIAAASANGSFGSDPTDKIVYYPAAFAAQYTSPWQEYTTAMGATLDFELGGNGSAIAGVTVIPAQSVPAPAAPSAAGFTFGGWFTASDYATPFDFGAPLAAGQSTAYAQWISLGAPGGPTLPVTGADTSPVVWTGAIALLVAGFTLVLLRRRAQLTQ